MLHIGFTGTREGMTTNQKDRFLKSLSKINFFEFRFHHGDCIGADEDAHNLLEKVYSFYSCPFVVIHPPINEKFRAFCQGEIIKQINQPKEYLQRNKDIVNEASVLIAVPKGPEELRSGTWSTIRYARKKNKSIYIIHPNGEFVYETSSSQTYT